MGHEEFTVRPISAGGVNRAIEKAERYRALNEPREAESIARDVLASEPTSVRAQTLLILAISDQVADGATSRAPDALAALDAVKDEYRRTYYHGVIVERQAKGLIKLGKTGARAYALLREAMGLYENAEKLSPESNDDAILRWNACARRINNDDRLTEGRVEQDYESIIDEDMPMR